MNVTRHVMTAVAMAAAITLTACGGEGGRDTGQAQSSHERAGDRGIGSPEAPVTMIEYASVACPACAAFHAEVWPMLESEYIEAGKVRFVFRESIAGSPQFAMAGFALAHCVPPEQYFDMIDLLFQQQRAILEAAQSQRNVRPQYLAIARSMGLSESEFTACLNDDEINASILAAHEQADRDGIGRTPSFLFNGEMLEARRASGDTVSTYFLGGHQLRVDGEPIPARADAETFRILLDHLVSEADQTAASEG
ncbi:thioredoxin domain-containing protein [Maricaulis sp. CAU 1757]